MTGPKSPGILSFFAPRSVAVAGVSSDPNKIGSVIFSNLVENRAKGLLKATVYAVNPAHRFIGDQPSYPSISSLPEVPELLVVAVPESLTVGLIRDAAKAGVRAAIIVTSGYAEAGRPRVEEEILELARKHGMRILGPNTIGVVDPFSGVDSLFLKRTKRFPDGSEVPSMLPPLKGKVAVLTQSGHLGQAVVEELTAAGVGIRALVGTGNQADVSLEEMIQYFADEPQTEVITAYLEGVRDGRKFLEAAYRASRKKPLIVFKVGKTGTGARAAFTHTASMVGSYDGYRAAFRQAGVVEALTFGELVDFTISLLLLPRRIGKRLAIITNAGGVGAIAADEATGIGLKMPGPSDRLVHSLRSEFKDAGFISNSSLGNPFDLTASSSTADFAKASELILSRGSYDAGLVLPTHQTPSIGYDIAEKMIEAVKRSGKPACACVIGREKFADHISQMLMSSGIPSFPTPERAVRALAAAIAYHGLSERAAKPATIGNRDRDSEEERPLSRIRVTAVLRKHRIVEPSSVVVLDPNHIRRVRRLNFPVVCKMLSKDVVHKTDIGGVVIGVSSTEQVQSCYERFVAISAKKHLGFDGMLVQELAEGGVELILGSVTDPTFGPVTVVGLGGTGAELAREVQTAISPVTPGFAKSMLSGPRIAPLLAGYRGGPRIDVDELSSVISRFSRIMIDSPRIRQFEINPLWARGDQALALDARGTEASDGAVVENVSKSARR